MPSQLTFDATESFRKKLLLRNLPPYRDGYRGNDTAGDSEFLIMDQPVNDGESVEKSRANDISREKSYLKNEYGPKDGFEDFIDITDIEKKIEARDTYYTFIFSVYNAFNILTDDDPVGSNGSLSQDSDLAKIGSKELKTQLQYRIGQETYQQTLGRINIIDALNDPFDALAIVTGNEQPIESDWKISVPENTVGKGLDFISRISGVYSPYSWIPGNYFGEVEPQSSINQASVGNSDFNIRGILKPNDNRTSSENFLSNTGRGQTKRLFKNLSLNVFSPDYTDNSRLFGLTAPAGNFYIGSKEQDPKDIVSPPTELPIDQYGNRVRVPVRGYGELGKLYENSYNFKFGLNGNRFVRNNNYTNSSYDAPRLQGGFTWVSLESIKASGRNVSQGGAMGSVDNNFISSVASSFDGTVSTQYDFKKGSILDDTQRLVNAADKLQGDARLQHVGNAINQVSKVFNDGTREFAKGSNVYKYENTQTGNIEGREYCRVFTKDIPYFSNDELQKSEGITTQNRRFTYSIFDSTYNLNIAPWRDEDSTNIQNEQVKKYMFSIENLAWRTSSKPGFTYQDLPHCERGPNGGRIMWFPPYDMKVSEQNSVSWTDNKFLGRPEPIFTYNNTTRQGSLSWKIVVDHPSILNAIVDKELSKENNQRVNDIVDSFFAGCRKYDIYELATRFPQFTYKDIYDIITTTQDKKEYYEYSKEIPRVETTITEPVIEEYEQKVKEEDYRFEWYFHNDIPGEPTASAITTEEPYGTSLSNYIGLKNQYQNNADDDQKVPTQEFFNNFVLGSGTTASDSLIETNTKILAKKMREAIDAGAKINFTLKGTCSAPNSSAYNVSLAKRRIDSIKKYLLSFSDLEKDKDKINIKELPQGEDAIVTPGDGSMGSLNCTDELFGNDRTYSTTAMGCRRVKIYDYSEVPPEPTEEETQPIIEENIFYDTITQTGETITKIPVTNYSPKKEVAKIIVKKLLTECDYFNMMREESPRVYEGIKEKIKYFQPVFHSITPEGLNSRLTFLQQCIRPGESIPVIGEDGKPRKGDIKNTAFGAPPICILRIGDFYHTKIAINQLSINYEPLVFDINPEGIGVQPMLADINISFYFIGGQGLKEPVSQLQNAISFNFYANTEVYDERSVVTETREDLNRRILDEIEESNDFSVKDGEIIRSEEAGNTIGEILTTDIGSGNTLTGNIKYKSTVNELVDKTKDYVQNVISNLETISKEQSKIGLYYFTKTRNFYNGNITGNLDNNNVLFTNIFGKPIDFEDEVNILYNAVNSDINNDSNPFLSKISLENFNNSDIKKFKKRLKLFVDLTKETFTSNFNSGMSELLENQTNLIRVIDKLNLILTNTDGFKNKSGNISILELSGTTDVDVTSQQSTTDEEMLSDIQTVGFDLQAFYDKIFDDSGLLPTKENLYSGFLTGTFDTEPQTRFCTISYPFIMSDPEYFIDLILGEELIEKPEWVSYVNKIMYGTPAVPNNLSQIIGGNTEPLVNAQSGLIDVYTKLKKASTTDIESFKNSDFVKVFTEYQPFNPDKERKFTYVQRKSDEMTSTEKTTYFETTFAGINGGEPNNYNLKYTLN